MLGNVVLHGGKKVHALLFAGILAIATASCDADATSPQLAGVQVLLTDAPSDMLDTATVWISRVYLQGGGGEEPDTAQAEGDEEDDDAGGMGGRVDLFNDPENPLVFDLLTLRDGVTADLTGVVDVDVGLYQSLRFVVDSARVVLAEGYVFEDGTRSGVLDVPSGFKSGIKVKLDDILDAGAGETITITVDFDVDENFVIQTGSQEGVVRRVIFKPVLKEHEREEEQDDS